MMNSTAHSGKMFGDTLRITTSEMQSLQAWKEVIAQVENMATEIPFSAMAYGFLQPEVFTAVRDCEIRFTHIPSRAGLPPKLIHLTSPLSTGDILSVLSLIRLSAIVRARTGTLQKHTA